MKIIHRHIFKEWFKVLCVAIALIAGILILEDMYKNLKTFLEHGANFRTLWSYYAYFVPNCLYTVLPISFFISVLYVLNDMQSSNEIIALRASGLTIFQITYSLWVAAILLMGFMVFSNAYLLPYTSDKMQAVVEKITYDEQVRSGLQPIQIGTQSHLCLYNEKAGRLWHIKTFSMYANRGTFVTLSLLNKQKKEIERIEAESITYDAVHQQWLFKQGKRWFFDKDTATPERFLNFETWTLPAAETPQIMYSIHKPLKNLNANELKKILAFVPKDQPTFTEHIIKYYSILSSPLICLIIVLLSIPFSLSGVRTNPMVGVSKAFGIFLVYYLIGNIGRMLGIQGTLHPLMAAWVPNLVMLAVGLLLYLKVTPR